MSGTAAPLISVIIPTFRALEYLRLSLPEFMKSPDCEVIVALDGDNAAYRNYLRDLPVRISATQRRQGACTASNLAAAAARGTYLFLCNDDMVPAPGWDHAMLGLAGENRIVSGTCWEPGLIAVPPPHATRDLGHDASSFRREEFFRAARAEPAVSEPGINYPFLIPKALWDRAGGLDRRFNPGSASDPDLFIRLRLLDPPPGMVRTTRAIFYHFASRSSSFAGGSVSLTWKIHRRHGRYMFLRKWGRMWSHTFGEVPDISAWRSITPRQEPLIAGRLWRRIMFGRAGTQQVTERAS
ncbi:MAG TPA: glycosyltransferase [Candidatus Edwardsbacteria bacterium]|nr:glycosyltransferase [Candidatus Edwardsbacteria bacterium]